MSRLGGAAGALALSALALTGCNATGPCAGLPSPDPAAVDLVRQGYEVELAGRGDAECELTPRGAWVQDVDQ